MTSLRALAARVVALFRASRLDGRLDEEIDAHIDMLTEENVRRGMAPEEARFAALRAFGPVAETKEIYRDRRGLPAVESLALGVGANTAVFSVVDAVMLRDLPVREPERLVLFGNGEDMGLTNGVPHRSWDLYSYPFYRGLREHNDVFSEAAAVRSTSSVLHAAVGAGGEPERVDAALVSGAYFSTLGVNAELGRVLDEDDDRAAVGSPVVVVSHAWWERRLGANPAAVGTTITVGRTPFTVVGVAPREFFGTTVGDAPDVWIPLAMEASLPPGWKLRDDRAAQSLYLVARLKDGVTVAASFGARAIASLLYGLAPTDPTALVAATLALIGVAAVAAWLPAHRASRVDPLTALRED